MGTKLKLVKPSTEFTTLNYFPDFFEKALLLIEECGRVSHKSDGAICEGSAEPFVRKVGILWGHETILEHMSFTVCFKMSRAASHQLVRHRIAAYCVSGDTVLVAHSKKGGSSKRWTIKQLYDWQSDPKRKGRLNLIRLRSVDQEGCIIPGKIKKIIDTGIQHTFQVKTRCNKTLRCTDNEWFKTKEGWKRLHELSIGDRIQVNGELAYKNKDWLQHQYLELNQGRKEVARLAGVSDACIGKWIAKFDLQKPYTQYPNRQPGHGKPGMHSELNRAEISERMKKEGNHQWKGDLAGEQAGRRRAQREYSLGECDCCDNQATHRHHVDENTLNNKEENVVLLCDTCHAGHHIGQAVFVVHYTPITSILACGVERTYDIEMDTEDPDLHNYIANGFLVHNTQESQRYCDYSKGEDPMLQIIVPSKIKEDMGEWWIDQNDIIAEKLPHSIQLDKSGLKKHLPLSCNLTKYLNNVMNSYEDYLCLLKEGIKAEDARYLLPNASKTEVYTTFNFRQWRHFFKMRMDSHAQWEIKEVANDVFDLFKERCPLLIENLYAHSGDKLE